MINELIMELITIYLNKILFTFIFLCFSKKMFYTNLKHSNQKSKVKPQVF